MRRITRVLASFALASTLALGAGTAALASTGNAADCPTGYACIFGDQLYVGPFYGSFYSERNLRFLSNGTNDMASSALSRGQKCDLRFYENVDFSGKSFTFGRSGLRELYADYKLSDGATAYGAYASENWDDRISGWQFVGTGC